MVSHPKASRVPQSAETAAEAAAARCLGCDYLLIGLSEHRCPECGRAFDPADETTFSTKTRSQRRRQLAKNLVVPLSLFYGAAISLTIFLIFLHPRLGTQVGGDLVGTILAVWFVHFCLAVLLASPLLWLGRNRAQWRLWEGTAFVVPYGLWIVLFIYGHSGKSPTNLLEFVSISLTIPLAVLTRTLLGHTRRQWLASVALIFLLCGVAVATFLVTPPL